ncbi:uncharacterized protein DUF3313 [Paraburkholderia eburnea]|uniref:Uncharacterized protein DUF3313 n=1 Tax=Paraburkholderia eburnea TaxID=1189126 RepID=A0A2S4LYL6_9BURK|nr:DUF3313 domain-containing protein [Paraburkholderia eburnea]POR47465.1 uncharacterized protein DUF3313 [Paraburkholderia eburnea]PRZ19053.1 uncharacterized protein DUF3313 [Paraburkholderia eburnea]
MRKKLLVIGCILLAGCASTAPVPHESLPSSTQLQTNPQDKDGRVPYVYAVPGVEWRRYTNVMVDPVAIYHGTDAQFKSTTEADRDAIAAYMQGQFTDVLKGHYTIVQVAAPDTLRIHLTLTGIATSTPVLAALTKISPAGLVINTVNNLQGRPAILTGSVSYAVDIYDSTSSRLLRAYTAWQYPGAENIAASFGALGAAKAGVRNGAQSLLAQLQ